MPRGRGTGCLHKISTTQHSAAPSNSPSPCSCAQVQREPAAEAEAEAAQQAGQRRQQAGQQPAGGGVEPFALVREEIETVSERLRRSVVTDIPSLEQAAEYFFRAGGRDGAGALAYSVGTGLGGGVGLNPDARITFALGFAVEQGAESFRAGGRGRGCRREPGSGRLH